MFKFNPRGQFQGSYDFGLDVTPNIYSHDGTYSILLKENHYGFGTYCTDPVFCPASSNGPFYVTQLSPDLTPEWKFASPTTESCHAALRSAFGYASAENLWIGELLLSWNPPE